MFEDDDDGDLDFRPSQDLSRLASIFGSEDDKTSSSGNRKLSYTAPKQKTPQTVESPIESSNSSTTSKSDQSSSVVIAVTAHLFILVNQNYTSQGKVGVALAQNKNSRTGQIILYRDKQKPLALVDIAPGFTFTVQNDIYANFADIRGVHYSLHFDSTEIAAKFALQVESFQEPKKSREPSNTPAPAKERVLSPSPNISEPLESVGNLDSPVNEELDKKASLIHRMARMGQPILPMLSKTTSIEAESTTAKQDTLSEDADAHHVDVPNLPSKGEVPPVLGPVAVWPVSQPVRTAIFDLEGVLKENQCHLAELKTDSSRSRDKLDQILVKVDTLQQQQILQQQTLQLHFLQSMQQAQFPSQMLPSQSQLSKSETQQRNADSGESSQVSRLEECVLSNERLRQVVDRQIVAINRLVQLHSKENIDMEEFDRLKEEHELVNQRLHVALQSIEDQQKKLEEILSQRDRLETDRNDQLQLLEEAQKRCVELHAELDGLKKLPPGSDEETNTETSPEADYEEKIAKLNEELAHTSLTVNQRVNSQVQRIMNTVYRQLLQNFSPDVTYSYGEIKATLSSVIREVTTSLLSGDNSPAAQPELPPPPVFSQEN